MPPVEFLRECFAVEGDALIWRRRPASHFPSARAATGWNGRLANRAVRYKRTNGYHVVAVTCDKTVRYALAHRVIWALAFGEPPPMLDHINGVKTDNRLANLRPTNKSLNAQNRRRADVDSKAGLLGVSPNGHRWKATIFAGGRSIYLGSFDEPSEAANAYAAAKRTYHEGSTL